MQKRSEEKKKMNSKNETRSEGGQSTEKNSIISKNMCLICHKAFTQKSNLNQHMLIHSGKKPFVCPTCPQQFRHKGALNAHMRIHSGERPYECPTCHKKFTRKENLSEHSNIHSNVRSHTCNSCPKAFYRKTDLIRHARIHSGDKPFVCDFCKKGFAERIALIHHLRVHSGEKAFSCSICKKAFALNGTLSRHHKLVHLSSKTPKVPATNFFIKKVNLKKEIDDDLEQNKSDFSFEVPLIKEERITEDELAVEPIPSTSYQNIFLKEEPNNYADSSCINLFDDSLVKEETEDLS